MVACFDEVLEPTCILGREPASFPSQRIVGPNDVRVDHLGTNFLGNLDLPRREEHHPMNLLHPLGNLDRLEGFLSPSGRSGDQQSMPDQQYLDSATYRMRNHGQFDR